jgi:hypothetical protein
VQIIFTPGSRITNLPFGCKAHVESIWRTRYKKGSTLTAKR